MNASLSVVSNAFHRRNDPVDLRYASRILDCSVLQVNEFFVFVNGIELASALLWKVRRFRRDKNVLSWSPSQLLSAGLKYLTEIR